MAALKRSLWSAAAGVSMLGLLACAPDQKSAVGFWLPDGDPEQGLVAFTEMRCHACHTVKGHDELPAPVAQPPLPVPLGGRVTYPPSDGELVTSIVNPSHKISSRYARDLYRSGELSRMADYTETMTVKQLIDLVAFLHTVYEPAPRQVAQRGGDWRVAPGSQR